MDLHTLRSLCILGIYQSGLTKDLNNLWFHLYYFTHLFFANLSSNWTHNSLRQAAGQVVELEIPFHWVLQIILTILD
uniref:Putative ovule protein n=1 Tax=Solanum chacoense TaxID=4108 RepID=A0A0V0HYR0_SOLCH